MSVLAFMSILPETLIIREELEDLLGYNAM
jgi:hypothetical protein